MTPADWAAQQIAAAPPMTQQQITDLRRIFVPAERQKQAS